MKGHASCWTQSPVYFWIREHFFPSEYSASIHSTEIVNVNTWLFLFLSCSCSNEVLLAIATMVKYSVVFSLLSRASSTTDPRLPALLLLSLGAFFSKNILQNVPRRSVPNPVPFTRWVAMFGLVYMAAKCPRPRACDVTGSSAPVLRCFVLVCRLKTGSFVVEKRKTVAD